MNEISSMLMLWYNENNYSMPWRDTNNVYKIWISEIMLQQTQVKTVIPYYEKWTKIFPDIQSVAEAEIESILKCWEGLGYYQRAHNIHHVAKEIINNKEGYFPTEYSDLIKLKGIGDYTASAIMSIVYQKPYPAIDGNIKRVMGRIQGISDFSNIINKSKDYVLKMMEGYKPGFIVQAIMDLGREVCLPKTPHCDICPIKQVCYAYQNQLIHTCSINNKSAIKPIHEVAVGLIWKKDKLLISKRKKNGLLGGLWELPGGKKYKNENYKNCLKREIFEELNININIKRKIGHIKHQYSHFGINMHGYVCQYISGRIELNSADEFKWITPNQINSLPFPKSTQKLFLIAGLINE